MKTMLFDVFNESKCLVAETNPIKQGLKLIF